MVGTKHERSFLEEVKAGEEAPNSRFRALCEVNAHSGLFMGNFDKHDIELIDFIPNSDGAMYKRRTARENECPFLAPNRRKVRQARRGIRVVLPINYPEQFRVK